MAYMYVVKSIQKLIQDIAKTIIRFPAPILLSMLACFLVYFEIHHVRSYPELQKNYVIVKLFLAAVCAIPLYIAFDFFAISKSIEQSKKFGLYLLGFCILGLHYYSIKTTMFDVDAIFVTRYLIFNVVFHLLVSIIAFYNSDEINHFWQYNYFLLVQISKSFGISISLFIGLGSAIWAVDNLFGMHFNPDYYIDLAALLFFVFNTIIFLNWMPQDFAVFSKKQEYKKSIRIFAQFVLLPIIGIYIVILYLYLFKILMEHRIPNGWISIPILVFSILGILAYLLLYPVKNEVKNKVVYVYTKYFFFILLPLLSLYFIAILKRIIPYGLTENRYLIFMLGIWMLIISIYFILSKKKNIIAIPVSLFLVLSVSAIGPWGMFQLSVQNQHYRLEKILKRNHLLENNKLVHLPNQNINDADAKSIRSIFLYLNKRGEINRIHRWLDEEDQKILEHAILNNETYSLQSIFINEDIDLKTHNLQEITFKNEQAFFEDFPYSILGYHQLIHFYLYQEKAETDSLYNFHLNQENLLQLTYQQDTLFSISLQNKINSLLQFQQIKDSIYNHKDNYTLKLIAGKNMIIDAPADSMILDIVGYRLLINQMNIQLLDSVSSINSIDAYLLIKD